MVSLYVSRACADHFHKSSGDGHTCAIEKGRAVIRCFGRNDFGQADAPTMSAERTIRTDAALPGASPDSPPPPPATATMVCAGALHSCAAWQADPPTAGAAFPHASLRCWGDDRWGQAAPPGPEALRPANPVVVALACGAFHTCALLAPPADGGRIGGGDADAGGATGDSAGRPVCWGKGAAARVPARWAGELFVSLTAGCRCGPTTAAEPPCLLPSREAPSAVLPRRIEACSIAVLPAPPLLRSSSLRLLRSSSLRLLRSSSLRLLPSSSLRLLRSSSLRLPSSSSLRLLPLLFSSAPSPPCLPSPPISS